MKLHIHLGAHKTGSTSLQFHLRKNEAKFADAGMAYIPMPEFRKRYSAFLNRIENRYPAFIRLLSPTIESRFRDQLVPLSGSSLVVISDENLLGGLAPIAAKHRLYPHAVRMVSAVKRAAGPNDAHYFLCIRNYPEFIVSMYLHLVIQGRRVPPLESVTADFLGGARGWAEVVADVANVVGADRLTVWTYEHYRDAPGAVLDVLAPGVPVELFVPPGNLAINRSLTAKGWQVMEALQDILTRTELASMGTLMRKFPFEEPNPKVVLDDPDALAELEDKYRRDKIAIAALGCRLLDGTRAG